jgi:hypothetical protein
MTAPLVDYHQIGVGESLPPLPFALSTEQVDAFLESTGEATASWRDLVPPHCLFAHAMAEATAVMPLPPSAVHAGTELAMQAPAARADGYVARLELTRRREAGGSVVSLFALTIATTGGVPTLAGSVTLVCDQPDGSA